MLNGSLTNYIGTLGKALAYPNGTGSPAQISIDIDLNVDDGRLASLSDSNKYFLLLPNLEILSFQGKKIPYPSFDIT